jgi:hypothetical protein
MEEQVATREGGRRKYRRLRIVWSIYWGVACLLLIALWVRGLWWADFVSVKVTTAYAVSVSKYPGTCAFTITTNPEFPLIAPGRYWNHERMPVPPVLRKDFVAKYLRKYFEYQFGYVIVPDWFLIFAFAGLGILAWFPWRFSLRTLLVAMTLVAVVLGVIVYAMR